MVIDKMWVEKGDVKKSVIGSGLLGVLWWHPLRWWPWKMTRLGWKLSYICILRSRAQELEELSEFLWAVQEISSDQNLDFWIPHCSVPVPSIHCHGNSLLSDFWAYRLASFWSILHTDTPLCLKPFSNSQSLTKE